MINQRLLDTHTNFLGKIVKIDFETEYNLISVQPLQGYKEYGKTVQTSAVITKVPLLFPYKYVWIVDKGTKELIEVTQLELEEGDTVYCGVCERNITEAENGESTISSTGRHHNFSDSIAIMGMSKVIYKERSG